MKKVGIILGVIAIGAISLAANTITFGVTGNVGLQQPTLSWVTSGAWSMGNVAVGTPITTTDPTQTIQVSGISVPAQSNMTIAVANSSVSAASWCGLDNLVLTPAIGGTTVTVLNNSTGAKTMWTEAFGVAASKNYTFSAAFSPATNVPTTAGSLAILLTFTGTVQSL